MLSVRTLYIDRRRNSLFNSLFDDLTEENHFMEMDDVNNSRVDGIYDTSLMLMIWQEIRPDSWSRIHVFFFNI